MIGSGNSIDPGLADLQPKEADVFETAQLLRNISSEEGLEVRNRRSVCRLLGEVAAKS
ncbi:MAG: hypothetical protein H0U53_06125 [Actinobacteria bacterium]|nr:hypothetical protein [Actinomycetota bacterium]